MCLAFPLGLLGVNPDFLCFHLGFHLESLGFDLGAPTRRQRQGLSQHF